MEICDMHVHVKEGVYELEKLNKILDEGIKKGITTFLLLDHGDRISPKKTAVLDNNNIPTFFANVDKVKREGIQVYKGIEVDFSYDEKFREEVIKTITTNKFDYVIGSVHSMNDLSEEMYYQAVIDMISVYPIDIIGHIRMNDHYMNHLERFKIIMDICRKKNIMIEINTSTRSLWNEEQLEFMHNLMKEYDVKYTIGSDAHKIEEIAVNYDLVKDYFNKKECFLNDKLYKRKNYR